MEHTFILTKTIYFHVSRLANSECANILSANFMKLTLMIYSRWNKFHLLFRLIFSVKR